MGKGNMLNYDINCPNYYPYSTHFCQIMQKLITLFDMQKQDNETSRIVRDYSFVWVCFLFSALTKPGSLVILNKVS